MNATLPDSVKHELPPKVTYLGWALLWLGIILYAVGYMVEPREAAFNNVIGFLFLTSVAVGALFLIALEYLTGAVWSVPMRRIVEFIAALIPLTPLLAIPAFFHLHDLFHWSHATAASDPVLAIKQPYLNIAAFSGRFVGIFVLWTFFFWLFTRFSLRQDTSRDQRYTMLNGRLSAIFMPLFAFSVSIVAIDWAMSLEAHWYSTIFGVYYFSGVVIAALAVATYIIVRFSEAGMLPGLRRDHYYSLGALQFAFVNFWAYIAFSQFMLIWYGNLPEETFWFMMRWKNGWQYVSILLILVQFWIPYFILLPQDAKMDPKRLKFVSIWLLVAHYIDLYWLVMPTYSPSVTVGWMEIGFPIILVGTILTVLAFKMKRHNLMPVGDPKFARGMEFHL